MSTYNLGEGVTEMSLVQEEKIKLEPVAKTQKLSVIIRSFVGKFKQARGTLYDIDDSYCVLGALAFDSGIPKHKIGVISNTYGELKNIYPQLRDQVPRRDNTTGTLSNYIMNLNDAKRYDFNQIADELEGMGY